jgi:hypothetical protein
MNASRDSQGALHKALKMFPVQLNSYRSRKVISKYATAFDAVYRVTGPCTR